MKKASSAERIGKLLRRQLERDPHFYLFSPDETTSNRLGAVFDSSKRAWDLPKRAWDLPESANGHIVEMLSENVLFSTMAGHLTNKEQAMMTSYEAFFPIVTSQILQYIKFLKQTNMTAWQTAYPAANLLSTSTCWRQDHNGFTHQSPALISALLGLPSRLCNCYFPVDDVAAEIIFRQMLKDRNVVNLTTFNKTPEPRWLDMNVAKKQLRTGLTILHDTTKTPQIIFVAVGDIMTREVMAAIEILKQDIPTLRTRCVNISALSYNVIGTVDAPITKAQFARCFGDKQPIIANFHGYPEALRSILTHYTNPERLSVHGYQDRGTTTTPFEMLAINQTSRYHLCIDAVQKIGKPELAQKYRRIVSNNHKYAIQFGTDKIEL